jgi:hypothetical protein
MATDAGRLWLNPIFYFQFQMFYCNKFLIS